ncbi:DUF1611 domain-containing protein [Paremcibacter congregatus]|uniref:EBNA-1 nuclear protein n=1 Tax=Paremcibacter congregatus TaxID=2043170 RepID=A0A2G4YQZ6_9PROT|nr:DUF1611 domain-containing protein [Paremcibacter congregatus]PHZ84745.1 EBNA-1 nuclear protein [Paremcibacter congregatus]QDE28937.1 DUF1611 domain-containing protein [Paremcibacter congregatus]
MTQKPLDLKTPYLLFLGDAQEDGLAKTAFGIHEWCPEKCKGQMRLDGCKVDLGLEDLNPVEAKTVHNVGTLVIGVANLGGYVPDNWVAPLCGALRAGLDIAAGLHTRLNDIEFLRETAKQLGRTIYDVRQTTQELKVGNGQKRSGKRLLTVAADCAIGKKYAALAIAKEMQSRGMAADFRATGQTGILIAGGGIGIDAVVADFISGAAEMVSPENAKDHWDIIEGQGALFHPAYAGVALGLLHGSQPDALVICHDPDRSHTAFMEGFALPDMETVIRRNIEAAQLTNPHVKVAGISVNTSRMTDDDAKFYMADLSQQTKLPVCDPVRTGMNNIVDYLVHDR